MIHCWQLRHHNRCLKPLAQVGWGHHRIRSNFGYCNIRYNLSLFVQHCYMFKFPSLYRLLPYGHHDSCPNPRELKATWIRMRPWCCHPSYVGLWLSKLGVGMGLVLECATSAPFKAVTLLTIWWLYTCLLVALAIGMFSLSFFIINFANNYYLQIVCSVTSISSWIT